MAHVCSLMFPLLSKPLKPPSSRTGTFFTAWAEFKNGLESNHCAGSSSRWGWFNNAKYIENSSSTVEHRDLIYWGVSWCIPTWLYYIFFMVNSGIFWWTKRVPVHVQSNLLSLQCTDHLGGFYQIPSTCSTFSPGKCNTKFQMSPLFYGNNVIVVSQQPGKVHSANNWIVSPVLAGDASIVRGMVPNGLHMIPSVQLKDVGSRRLFCVENRSFPSLWWSPNYPYLAPLVHRPQSFEGYSTLGPLDVRFRYVFPTTSAGSTWKPETWDLNRSVFFSF